MIININKIDDKKIFGFAVIKALNTETFYKVSQMVVSQYLDNKKAVTEVLSKENVIRFFAIYLNNNIQFYEKK